MTQIIVTLESSANSSLIQKMIENMKGVFKVSVKIDDSNENISDEWVNQVKELSNSVDPSIIDMDDERTRYIMSK